MEKQEILYYIDQAGLRDIVDNLEDNLIELIVNVMNYCSNIAKENPERPAQAIKDISDKLTDSHYKRDYDDSMDGDHASALASVGWGVDEDYVQDYEY
jgi:hypothetical protein